MLLCVGLVTKGAGQAWWEAMVETVTSTNREPTMDGSRSRIQEILWNKNRFLKTSWLSLTATAELGGAPCFIYMFALIFFCLNWTLTHIWAPRLGANTCPGFHARIRPQVGSDFCQKWPHTGPSRKSFDELTSNSQRAALNSSGADCCDHKCENNWLRWNVGNTKYPLTASSQVLLIISPWWTDHLQVCRPL